MSKIIRAFNNISNETKEKMSPTNNVKLYSLFEDGCYDKYLSSIVDQIEREHFIDIYSLFIAMNAEMFLKIDDSDACYKTLDNYIKFIKDSFEEISPRDQSQKNMLCERGIDNFLTFININLNKKLRDEQESNKIDLDATKITHYLHDLLSFLSKKEIKFNDNLKKNIFETLEKISCEQVNSQISEEDSVKSKSQAPDNKKSGKSNNIRENSSNTRSHKWMELLDKIEVLKELVKSNRLFETAIVYDDIRNKITKFDPKEYFPDVFFPLYKSITPVARKIHLSINDYSSTVQWEMAKKMYDIDYKSFLLDYERMPENDFIENKKAQEHFYNSSLEPNHSDSDADNDNDNDNDNFF